MNTTAFWEKELILTRRAAEYLHEVRIAENLKITEVAARSHGVLSASWLSTFERGGLGGPSFMRMVALAEIYGLSLDTLRNIFLGRPIEEEERAVHTETL